MASTIRHGFFNTNAVCHDYVNKNMATGLVLKKKGWDENGRWGVEHH